MLFESWDTCRSLMVIILHKECNAWDATAENSIKYLVKSRRFGEMKYIFTIKVTFSLKWKDKKSKNSKFLF